jgi:hypothetical protein
VGLNREADILHDNKKKMIMRYSQSLILFTMVSLWGCQTFNPNQALLDDDYQLFKFIEFNYFGFLQPSNKYKTVEVYFKSSQETPDRRHTHTFSYDNNGRIVKMQVLRQNVVALSDSFSYFPQSINRVRRIDMNSEAGFRTNYRFTGNIIRYDLSVPDGDFKGEIKKIQKNTYADTETNVSSGETRAGDTFVISSEGLPLSRKTDSWVRNAMSNFEWLWEDGHLKQIIASVNGFSNQKITFYYNSDNCIVEEDTLDPSGRIIGIETFEYS